MIIGQVLKADDVEKVYYSPWMPAEGNLAVVSCEVIEGNATNFDITVQTKNSENDDNGATVPHPGTANNITVATETITKFNVGAPLSSSDPGFKELFRYKYEVTYDAGGSGFVHFRMLNPSWLTH